MGPSPNPRHGGVAPRECWPGLIWGWTAAGQAELGHPGLIWVTSILRLPLRRGGRGSSRAGPSPNLWNGGVALRERQPGLIEGMTATGRVELGCSGFNRATTFLRPPLRWGGRGRARNLRRIQGKL